MNSRICVVEGCGGKHRCKGYCNRHYSAMRKHGQPVVTRPTLDERFWAKVAGAGNPESCWQWTGAINTNGYGNFWDVEQQRTVGAHHFAYARLVGGVPDGLHLDHLCRNRSCVNPDHLEPVTPRENVLRGEAPKVLIRRSGACLHGHPFGANNTYEWPAGSGRRLCRTCRKASLTRRRLAEREQMSPNQHTQEAS